MTNPTAQEVAPPSPKSVEWWILQLPQPLLAEANAPGLEADGWDGVPTETTSAESGTSF